MCFGSQVLLSLSYKPRCSALHALGEMPFCLSTLCRGFYSLSFHFSESSAFSSFISSSSDKLELILSRLSLPLFPSSRFFFLFFYGYPFFTHSPVLSLRIVSCYSYSLSRLPSSPFFLSSCSFFVHFSRILHFFLSSSIRAPGTLAFFYFRSI
jgi:hypothetical protein